MSYKVVRNSLGKVLAFGPDDDNYDPAIAGDCSLHIEDDEPALIPDQKKLAADQINALESKHLLPRVVREYMLVDFRDKAAKAGLDPMTLPAYVKLKALDDQISMLRGQL